MIASNPFLQTTFQGSFTTNRDAVVIQLSSGLSQILGFSLKDLQNHSFLFEQDKQGKFRPFLVPEHAAEWEGEVFLLDKQEVFRKAKLQSVKVETEGVFLRWNNIALLPVQPPSLCHDSSITVAQAGLDLLMKETEQGFLLVDENLHIVLYNESFAKQYQELMGRPVKSGGHVREFTASDDPEMVRKIYERALAGEATNVELKFNLEGQLSVYMMRYKPVRYGPDARKGVFVSATEITIQKEMEYNLQQREKRFQWLTEVGMDAVAILDETANPIYVSPGVVTLLGYSVAEFMQMDMLSLVHEYDLEKAYVAWEEILEKPGVSIKWPPMRLRHKDGNWRWIQETFTNMLHEPSVAGIIDNCRDVTDIVLAHEDLLQKQWQIEMAEKNYREIFEKGNDGVFIFDTEKVLLTEVNDSACKLFGCTRQEMLNSSRKRFQSDIPGYEIRKVMEKFNLVMAGHHQVFEWPIKRADGIQCWLEVSIKRASIAGSERVLAFFRNIDHRKKTQEELQRLSQIARETNNAVVITDLTCNIEWVNEAFSRISGYSFQEVIGRKPGDVLNGPETSEAIKRFIRMKHFQRKPFSCDILNYSKSGRKYWIRIESQPRYDEFGNLLGFFAIESEITKEKEAEAAVKRSEEKYRNLFEFNPSCIIIWDPYTLDILEVNNKAAEVYGYSREEFLKLSMLSIRPSYEYERLKSVARAFITNGHTSYKAVWSHLSKTGEDLPMRCSSHFITYNGRKAVLAISDNIKQKLVLEKALEEERTRKQTEITEAVLLAQERERKEIGEELHDNVNQILAGAILYLGLSKKEETKGLPFLQETEKLLNSAIFELRNLSHSLIPPRLPEQGLAESLENVIKVTEAAGLTICRDFSGLDAEEVSPKLRLNIYRIVQEHLGNILKHAKASNILISIVHKKKKLRLRIKDDGIGFDPSAKSKGVGLLNIRTRASLFNSRVQIKSAKGAGCELAICFDLQHAAGVEN